MYTESPKIWKHLGEDYLEEEDLQDTFKTISWHVSLAWCLVSISSLLLLCVARKISKRSASKYLNHKHRYIYHYVADSLRLSWNLLLTSSMVISCQVLCIRLTMFYHLWFLALHGVVDLATMVGDIYRGRFRMYSHLSMTRVLQFIATKYNLLYEFGHRRFCMHLTSFSFDLRQQVTYAYHKLVHGHRE